MKLRPCVVLSIALAVSSCSQTSPELQAVVDAAERGHLLGDVPALFIVAIVLAILTPRGGSTRKAGSAS